jgi:Tol biopolymer transport system component
VSARLYLVNADGSGLRNAGPGGDDDPVWSPDGRRIAFSTRDTHAGMYVVDSDGNRTETVGHRGRRRLVA